MRAHSTFLEAVLFQWVNPKVWAIPRWPRPRGYAAGLGPWGEAPQRLALALFRPQPFRLPVLGPLAGSAPGAFADHAHGRGKSSRGSWPRAPRGLPPSWSFSRGGLYQGTAPEGPRCSAFSNAGRSLPDLHRDRRPPASAVAVHCGPIPNRSNGFTRSPGLMSVIVAAVEVGADLVHGPRRRPAVPLGAPAEVLSAHGTELILAAAFILRASAPDPGSRRGASEQRHPAAAGRP